MTTKPINRDPLADLNMGQGPYVLPEGSRHESEHLRVDESDAEPAENSASDESTEDADYTI